MIKRRIMPHGPEWTRVMNSIVLFLLTLVEGVDTIAQRRIAKLLRVERFAEIAVSLYDRAMSLPDGPDQERAQEALLATGANYYILLRILLDFHESNTQRSSCGSRLRIVATRRVEMRVLGEAVHRRSSMRMRPPSSRRISAHRYASTSSRATSSCFERSQGPARTFTSGGCAA